MLLNVLVIGYTYENNEDILVILELDHLLN